MLKEIFEKYDTDYSGKIERNEAYKVIQFILKEIGIESELIKQDFIDNAFD